jgi:hypothetical protein
MLSPFFTSHLPSTKVPPAITTRCRIPHNTRPLENVIRSRRSSGNARRDAPLLAAWPPRYHQLVTSLLDLLTPFEKAAGL